MCMNKSGEYLFSAEAGQNSIIRIWEINSMKCINIFQSKVANIFQMRYF